MARIEEGVGATSRWAQNPFNLHRAQKPTRSALGAPCADSETLRGLHYAGFDGSSIVREAQRNPHRAKKLTVPLITNKTYRALFLIGFALFTPQE